MTKVGKFNNFSGKGNTKGFSKSNQPTSTSKSEGWAKKKKLRKLIRDLCTEYKSKQVTEIEKAKIYQLYQIALSDYDLKQAKVNGDSSLKHLYFIKSSIGIKIGVSKNVKERLKKIQIYSSDAEIYKIIPYAAQYESKIHKKFNRINIRNNKKIGIEWFALAKELMQWITELQSIECLIKEFGKNSTISICKQLNLFELNYG